MGQRVQAMADRLAGVANALETWAQAGDPLGEDDYAANSIAWMIAAELVRAEAIRLGSKVAPESPRWMLIQRRDDEPIDVALVEDGPSAMKAYEEASVQWSETYLCRVVLGPLDACSPATHIAPASPPREGAYLGYLVVRENESGLTRSFFPASDKPAAVEQFTSWKKPWARVELCAILLTSEHETT